MGGSPRHGVTGWNILVTGAGIRTIGALNWTTDEEIRATDVITERAEEIQCIEKNTIHLDGVVIHGKSIRGPMIQDSHGGIQVSATLSHRTVRLIGTEEAGRQRNMATASLRLTTPHSAILPQIRELQADHRPVHPQGREGEGGPV